MARNLEQSTTNFGAACGLDVLNGRDAAVFEDEVFITDTCNHRIVVTDMNGSLKRYFGCGDDSVSRHFDPWGIAISQNGKVYVTDMKNHIVFRFDKRGHLRQKFGYAELKGPYGITLDAKGNIIVVDFKSCCIRTFYDNGIFKEKFYPSKGFEFSAPRLIAVNSNGDRIIADYGNCRLIVTSDNNPTRSVPLLVDNKLYLARGVTLDEDDNIYVSVASSRIPLIRQFHVFMFSSDYTYQGRISRPGDIHMPRGMCVTYMNDKKFLLVAGSYAIHQYALSAAEAESRSTGRNLVCQKPFAETQT